MIINCDIRPRSLFCSSVSDRKFCTASELQGDQDADNHDPDLQNNGEPIAISQLRSQLSQYHFCTPLPGAFNAKELFEASAVTKCSCSLIYMKTVAERPYAVATFVACKSLTGVLTQSLRLDDQVYNG